MNKVKVWDGAFQFRIGDSNPQKTQVALTPDKTVDFVVTVDGHWHRPITHPIPIFGIHYTNPETRGENLVFLCFHQIETEDNEIQGEWSMGYPSEEDHTESLMYKKIANFTNFDTGYRFKLGWEPNKFFINYVQEVVTTQTILSMDDPGDPVRFQHPQQPRSAFIKRWDVKIALVNG